jgi:hypothetical protein
MTVERLHAPLLAKATVEEDFSGGLQLNLGNRSQLNRKQQGKPGIAIFFTI